MALSSGFLKGVFVGYDTSQSPYLCDILHNYYVYQLTPYSIGTRVYTYEHLH